MVEPEKLLTFILSDDQNEVEVQMNKKGLEDLVYYLQRLLYSSSTVPRHDHLMTESWAGSELTERNEGEIGTVLHKITLRYLS